MDKEDAEKLSLLMIQLNAKINESISFVQTHDKEQLFDNYAKLVGKVMGILYIDIARKLWEKYPELKPEEMGGPYKVDQKIFEPRFYNNEII